MLHSRPNTLHANASDEPHWPAPVSLASRLGVEAPASRQDLEAIGRRSPAPNVANMIEGGRTPVLPQQELAALGFHLILYPLAGLFAAARAIEAVYRTLRESGTTLEEAGRLMTFAEFNDLIGVNEKFALAERYGADS